MASEFLITEFGAVPDSLQLQTGAIQRAIDAAAAGGGGCVRIPRGTYVAGTLRLASHLTLKLDEGAVLMGSSDIGDYDVRYWGGGFIVCTDLDRVTIEGPGVIDGADCRNPKGEEGFRGPHCIAFANCTNIVVRNLTVRRSANWAFNCMSCSDVRFERVAIFGGHDGVDSMHSRRLVFTDCDFRTGDDCIAGADNHDYTFENCFFNSSCNGLRLSCIGLTMRNCRFKGPGEAVHMITGKNEMLAAFVHLSPPDRPGCSGPQPHSDEWLIENCTIEDVNQLYEFDHRTLWQNGRPVKHVTFRDVTATGLRKPIWVCGDNRRQFHLTLERVRLALPYGTWFHHPFIDLRSFDCLDVRGLTCVGVDDSHPAISTVDGLRIDVRDLRCESPQRPA